MSDDTTALVLALATENAELRAALAEAQDLLVETAVDAGELHARVEDLQARLVEARAQRDAWRIEAGQRRGPMLKVADGLLQRPPLDACAPAAVANVDKQPSTESTR